MKLEKLLTDQIDEIGDQHLSNKETPMRPDAFDLTSEKLIDRRKMRVDDVWYGS